jgi:peroxiredoxin
MFSTPTRSNFAPTMELGPRIGSVAPAFSAANHTGQVCASETLMGERGLILGFIGDIWQQASVQRIFWLERHSHTFMKAGFQVALLICDEPHMLYGFYVSSATPPQFPLLADVDREIHQTFNMTMHPGMVLLDKQHLIREKWLMPDDRVWPKINDMMETLEAL